MLGTTTGKKKCEMGRESKKEKKKVEYSLAGQTTRDETRQEN